MLLGVSLARAQSPVASPPTFDVSGYVWSNLPTGQATPVAGANIYVWPADTTVTRLLARACLAEATDPSAWMGARTELIDSSGIALDGNARLDLQVLHQLMPMVLGTGRADSLGHFEVIGLPYGDYWFEAEQMTGSKVTQWWRQVSYMNIFPFDRSSFVYRDVDLGFRQSATNQFCTKPDAQIGTAAFDDGKPPVMPGRIYGDGQVDVLPRLITAIAQPKYPPDLVANGISGAVTAQFVVDTTGRIDMSTFRIARSTDIRFSDAVRAALREMQYKPGVLREHKVRVMVSQPFNFGIKN